MAEQAKLGARIKKWRESQNVSRAELAENTGLTEQFITSLEEENLCPALGSLQRIARALNTRLGTFMDDHISKDPVISRKNEREADLIMQRARDKSPSMCFYSLAGGKSDRAMEPFFIEILPDDAGEQKAFSSHQGEEFLLVLSGKLKVVYGSETSYLEEGDSMYFNSVVPHCVTAADAQPAQIYAVLYNPA